MLPPVELRLRKVNRAHTITRPSGRKTHFYLSCDSLLLNPPCDPQGSESGIQWRKVNKSHRSYTATRALSRNDLRAAVRATAPHLARVKRDVRSWRWSGERES